MQSKLNDLAERSSVAGLTINVSKTKPLVANTDNPSNFSVTEQAVENVEIFLYFLKPIRRPELRSS